MWVQFKILKMAPQVASPKVTDLQAYCTKERTAASKPDLLTCSPAGHYGHFTYINSISDKQNFFFYIYFCILIFTIRSSFHRHRSVDVEQIKLVSQGFKKIKYLSISDNFFNFWFKFESFLDIFQLLDEIHVSHGAPSSCCLQIFSRYFCIPAVATRCAQMSHEHRGTFSRSVFKRYH